MNYSIYTTRSTTDSNAPAVGGVAVSGTNTYYSDAMSGTNADGFGLQLQWTGTPTGTFTLWMSDDEFPNFSSDTDWVQDTSFAPSNPAGAPGNMRDDVANAKARWKRVKYVNASGTGVLKGWMSVQRHS